MRFLPALLVDAVLVLVFAAIGRASHQEDPAGFLLTAWPFLVALLLGHAAALLLPGRPRRPWSLPWGAVVWAVTVVGGMLLRLVSGDTAELPFIIVATLVLGAFLLGWRGLAALVRRRRSPRETETESGTGLPAAVDSAADPDAAAEPAPTAADADAEDATPAEGDTSASEEKPHSGSSSD
ncbi:MULTISPECIES: DUF3054 domain-containing protein [Microbacterium]|jgi:hypothetical protein|uniref:DUF3054 domain-containing protein n=1 Tax=Microbacterium paraoxydans TaxID=199592 RepID=A0A1H1V790_9MICO|nr:DUF3054 domain-containing protein [Microbacterium paraoxydans]SDS80618.1 Protein of unknown function [Microbacterium paraoxydans]